MTLTWDEATAIDNEWGEHGWAESLEGGLEPYGYWWVDVVEVLHRQQQAEDHETYKEVMAAALNSEAVAALQADMDEGTPSAELRAALEKLWAGDDDE